MRLITTNPDGSLCLKEFVGKNIPPYAILSHTWGADEDEVTYHDLTAEARTPFLRQQIRPSHYAHQSSHYAHKTSHYVHKAGFQKLLFCVKQAAVDGLQYAWVDTCCIDKSSSAELSEAINSMYSWYRNAAKCYAFLADVDSFDLSKSRWFTRGWTLQELLAPKNVEFFRNDGIRIGDKRSSQHRLHRITGIPINALNGERDLLKFSVLERFSWAEGRETKREEDMAYCLLGLFDAHISLLYGEGLEKATKRLKREIIAMEYDNTNDPDVKGVSPPPLIKSTPPETTNPPMERPSPPDSDNPLDAIVRWVSIWSPPQPGATGTRPPLHFPPITAEPRRNDDVGRQTISALSLILRMASDATNEQDRRG